MVDEIAVIHRPGESRFVITVDGEEAGYTEYRSHPGVRAFMHTVIDEAFQGKGLASHLITRALDKTRAEGLLVEPYCPYVRSFIQKNEAYLELVAPDRREAFGL